MIMNLTMTNYLIRLIIIVCRILDTVDKAIHTSSPTYISNIFNERKSKYNLRGERALNIPSVNTTKYGLHSIRYLGPKLWNSISNDPYKLNLKEFKLAIRNINLPSHCCSFCNTYVIIIVI